MLHLNNFLIWHFCLSESFFKYFNKFGEVTDSVIMMNKHSGRPRGFGFVTFADSAVADEVLAQEHTIDGRVVTCCFNFEDAGSNILVHILGLGDKVSFVLSG